MYVAGNHQCWRWQGGDEREYLAPADLYALIAGRTLIRETGIKDDTYSWATPTFATAKQAVRDAHPAFDVLGLPFRRRPPGRRDARRRDGDGRRGPRALGALVGRLAERRHDGRRGAHDLRPAAEPARGAHAAGAGRRVPPTLVSQPR